KLGQRACAATELEFDEIHLDDSRIVGKLRQGWAINRAVLNYSRIPVGGIALGIARSGVEAGLNWLAQQPHLLERQSIQLEIADIVGQLSSLRATLWQHASLLVPRQFRASAAKVQAGDLVVEVCQRMMQLVGPEAIAHGPIEKAWRDARLNQIYEGTNQINRLAMFEELAWRYKDKEGWHV
ncbi:MAG: acyl-CoA dehydrogenase, partial [Candidatus Dadabacteria bacterium]